MNKTLKEISDIHCGWIKEMGWVDSTTPLEKVALIASEIGEAANECRGEHPTENFKYELSDIVLRCLSTAKACNIDIEGAIMEKIEMNKVKGNRGRKK